MNISVPRVGSMQYMAQDLCDRLGLGFVETPEYTERTVERGVAIAPEFVCFPMKVLLGSAIESLEAGADTLVTVAGYGACRFNYFAEIQRRILEREGYRFQIVVFDSPRDSLGDFYRNLRVVLRGSSVHFPGLVREMSLAVRKRWRPRWERSTPQSRNAGKSSRVRAPGPRSRKPARRSPRGSTGCPSMRSARTSALASRAR
jgi:hypothetical protein